MRNSVPFYIRLIVSRTLKGMRIVASVRQNVNAWKFLVKKSNIKKPFGRYRYRYEDNNKCVFIK